jgi:hypothetical protein
VFAIEFEVENGQKIFPMRIRQDALGTADKSYVGRACLQEFFGLRLCFPRGRGCLAERLTILVLPNSSAFFQTRRLELIWTRQRRPFQAASSALLQIETTQSIHLEKERFVK